MTEATKKRLALENNFKKDRYDDTIKKLVKDEIGFPEENACCRKIIASICKVLEANGFKLDEAALSEFEAYNEHVETIKREVKEASEYDH
jgi:hypothetical protein